MASKSSGGKYLNKNRTPGIGRTSRRPDTSHHTDSDRREWTGGPRDPENAAVNRRSRELNGIPETRQQKWRRRRTCQKEKTHTWWIAVCAACAVAVLFVGLRFMLKSAPEKEQRHSGEIVGAQEATYPTILTPYGIAEVADGITQEDMEMLGLNETVTAEAPDNHIAENSPSREILPEYRPLCEKNGDMFGWIEIDNTRIDFPVMYNGEDPEKYLHANFNMEDSFMGVPFLDSKCSASSDQLIVYGHNMKDGSMFSDLLKYEDPEFQEENPVIHFSTRHEHYQFEVMAVLRDQVYYKTDNCFKFYQFIDAANEEEYKNAVRYYKENSLYDTGITAQYGDQLLAVVTCAYHTEDGRFVVIGKKTPS